MKYPEAWKGRVKVRGCGRVYEDGAFIGVVASHYKKGARSPGGMVTNLEWTGSALDGRFASMTLAIESILREAAQGRDADRRISEGRTA